MDKAQALHNFWSSFSLPAYDERTVPKSASMPYITYNVSTGAIGDIILLDASLWYRSSDWAEITHKADEIAEYIGAEGHRMIEFDTGLAMLVQGEPFAQRMDDDSDRGIRRMYINVMAEFFSAW